MSASNDDPFYSAKRRLARAKKHAIDLDATYVAFINSDPYVRAIELDADGITKLHKIKLANPFPEELSDIASDAFDNLRSVLDQIAYGAGFANIKAPPQFATFPFSNNAKNWQDRADGMAKDVPSDIRTLFGAYEPYPRGKGEPLWALNELRNVNQHAMLAPLGAASVQLIGPSFFMKAPANGSISFNLPMWTPSTWDNCKNEMVIFREEPGGQLDYDFKLSPFIAFGNVVHFANEPVMGAFNYLFGMINEILARTEEKCRRLGLIT
jgi:hypothetical protein